MTTSTIEFNPRSCDGCTKCCEGWLTGTAFGYAFYPGQPCKFIDKKGCGIYNVRPKDPCVGFQCTWKLNKNIPEWLKPNLSGIMITYRKLESYRYMSILSAGKPVDKKVIDWATESVNDGTVKHVCYSADGEWHFISNDDEFLKLIKSVYLKN
jgi:hypothetical protein